MREMDAKAAITAAKLYLRETFGDELTAPPTLEEIWLDEAKGEWSVTLGVRRSTNRVEKDLLHDPLGGRQRTIPDYKVVRIDARSGAVRAVLNRAACRQFPPHSGRAWADAVSSIVSVS